MTDKVDVGVNVIDQSKPGKLDIFLGIIVLSLAFSFFMAMQYAGYKQDIRNSRMSALEANGKAHAFIVPNYRACMSGRGQTHITCVGSVAKSAEIKGFTIDDIREVFIEIEAVSAQNRAD